MRVPHPLGPFECAPFEGVNYRRFFPVVSVAMTVSVAVTFFPVVSVAMTVSVAVTMDVDVVVVVAVWP